MPVAPQHNPDGPPLAAGVQQSRRPGGDESSAGFFGRGWAWILGHRMWAGITGVVTIIGVLIAAAGLMSPEPPSSTNTNSNNSQTGSRCSANGDHITVSCSEAGTTASPSGGGAVPVNSKPDANSPLQLATVWPWVSGCPAYGSAIAMPVGGGALQDFHSAGDLGPTLAANGGGSWVRGSMYLHLQAATGKRLEIVDLKPHIQRRDLAPPAWVYVQQSGCGPGPGDRVFSLNLDTPLLTDGGIENSINHKAAAPTADLGTGFIVNDHDDTQIRLDSTACAGNYQWTVCQWPTRSTRWWPDISTHPVR
jgi:hypothetical protein